MCLEDLKLGRGRMVGQPVQLPATQLSALPADPTRVAIIVSWTGILTFTGAGAVGNLDVLSLFFGPNSQGFPHIEYAGFGLLQVLRIEDVGQAITGPISVVISQSTGFGLCTLTPITSEVRADPAMRDYKS